MNHTRLSLGLGLCLALGAGLGSGCDPAAPLPTDEALVADDSDASAASDARLVSGEHALASGPRLGVTLVDVGQGDGMVVQLPGGAVMVVDGGPRASAMVDYLRDQGIKRVDYVVLTHAHDDHFTGLPAVLSLLPKDCRKRVIDPGYNNDLVGYQDFRSAAGCQYAAASRGQSLNLDPRVEISVMGAERTPPTSDGSHGVNNTSVVLRLRFGSFSMLLDGDAEVTAEQGMYHRGPSLLRSTVLKMGHHGSCTASGSSYLRAVSPQFMVMSVGTGNSYGLPHCQTMDKLKPLRAAGRHWLRTDVNGTIRISSDGRSYAVIPSRGADSVASCPRDCAQPLDF